MSLKIAVVGATGAVGQKFIECLERMNVNVGELALFASPKSEGKVLHFKDTPLRVQPLKADSLKGFQFGLWSAGSSISKELAPTAAKHGMIVIDNSSAFRMDKDTPLVVPEVNGHAAKKNKGIIANPNCSTIQMVVALNPLHKKWNLRRVVVSTYQAVSGAGGRALWEFEHETRSLVFKDMTFKREIFPRQIAMNVIPQIPQKDAYLEDGYTVEERKMILETKKIMEDDGIAVTATCVRVPVAHSHSESVNAEFAHKLTLVEVFDALRNAPGVVLKEKQEEFPCPIEATGKFETFVGRIRIDNTNPNAVNMWVVADNLLKGAASNAVQILQLLAK